MNILIRRYTLLALVALVSYTLGESQTPTVADQVYTLDSLSKGTSEYYVPREVSHDNMIE